MNFSEASSRIRINSMLLDSGWRIEAKSGKGPNVGFEQDIRDPQTKRNLGLVRPDYHLYLDDSNIPISFIEAKKPGQSLDKAIEQATCYANQATKPYSPRMIVIASDGIQVRTQHANGKVLTLNGVAIDFIPSPELSAELIDEPSLSRGNVISHADHLIQIFRDASNSMRADGIDHGIESLKEFCTLLFIKIMSERGDAESRESWTSLRTNVGRSLLDRYKEVLNKYRQRYGDIFLHSNIRRPQTIESIRNQLDNINFTSTDVDVKGEAFEYFLRRYNAGRTSVLGQYFTPRHIARLLAGLLNPISGDKVLDPFCGTGGMLIMCYNLMRQSIHDENEQETKKQLKILREESLFGRDISNGASSLAKMNMVLIGDGYTNIENIDSLENLEAKSITKL